MILHKTNFQKIPVSPNSAPMRYEEPLKQITEEKIFIRMTIFHFRAEHEKGGWGLLINPKHNKI